MPKHDQLPEGLSYPCEMDIKVFTKAESDFLRQIRLVLEQDLKPDQVIDIRQKQSAKGNYHAFSCKVRLYSPEESDQVFQTLNAHPQVVMVL